MIAQKFCLYWSSKLHMFKSVRWNFYWLAAIISNCHTWASFPHDLLADEHIIDHTVRWDSVSSSLVFPSGWQYGLTLRSHCHLLTMSEILSPMIDLDPQRDDPKQRKLEAATKSIFDESLFLISRRWSITLITWWDKSFTSGDWWIRRVSFVFWVREKVSDIINSYFSLTHFHLFDCFAAIIFCMRWCSEFGITWLFNSGGELPGTRGFPSFVWRRKSSFQRTLILIVLNIHKSQNFRNSRILEWFCSWSWVVLHWQRNEVFEKKISLRTWSANFSWNTPFQAWRINIFWRKIQIATTLLQ